MLNTKKALFAVLALSAAAVSCAQQIQVQVDGKSVYFPDAQPQSINDHVLVPLRGVFEMMGASVGWNSNTRTVTASKPGTNIELVIGDRSASINGSNINMEIPAMIMGGSTMVPIRFVSEALGAQVGWKQAENLVSITTGGEGSFQTDGRNNDQNYQRQQEQRRREQERQQGQRIVFSRYDVIPVTLNDTLTSMDSRRGDTFSANVRVDRGETYGELPRGARIEGHVAAVHARNGNKPALIDLAFDRLVFPNGRKVNINGTLTSLDNKHVSRNSNGVMVVRNNRDNDVDQRMVYAGYGAGGGLLLGILGDKPVEGTVLGGVLGYILGQVDMDKRRKPSNIILRPGTAMGVRIDRDVMVNWQRGR